MASRECTTSIKCAEPGCRDHAHFVYRTQKEYAEIHRWQATHPYECTRHRDRQEVLRLDNPERTRVVVAGRTMGLPELYWIDESTGQAGSGLAFGPGFSAHANDFPEGTRLVVTARIELPADDVPVSSAEQDSGHAGGSRD